MSRPILPALAAEPVGRRGGAALAGGLTAPGRCSRDLRSVMGAGGQCTALVRPARVVLDLLALALGLVHVVVHRRRHGEFFEFKKLTMAAVGVTAAAAAPQRLRQKGLLRGLLVRPMADTPPPRQGAAPATRWTRVSRPALLAGSSISAQLCTPRWQGPC